MRADFSLEIVEARRQPLKSAERKKKKLVNPEFFSNNTILKMKVK